MTDIAKNMFDPKCSDKQSEPMCKGNLDVAEFVNTMKQQDLNSLARFYVHMNTRSLIKNIDKLESFLAMMPVLPEIIVISETKLKNQNLDLVSLPNYQFHCVNSPTNSGGIGMYLSSSFNYKIRSDLSLKVNQVEDLWVEIYPQSRTIATTKFTVVGGVYFHPHASIWEFQNQLEQVLEKLNNENKTFYVLGDFNINYLSDSKNIIHYKQSLESLGVSNLITCPTRFKKNQTPSLLDHIYYNKQLQNVIGGTIAFDMSDHNIVFTYSHKNCKKQSKTHWPAVFKRDFKNFKEETYLLQLEAEMLNLQKSTCGTQDVEMQFSNFVNGFLKCLDQNAPMRKLSRKQAKFYFKPWLTKGLQRSIKTKHKLYKNSCRHSHSEYYFKKYKDYNKILNNLKNRSKQNYFRTQFEKHKGDTKHTWKTINEIIRKKAPSANVDYNLPNRQCIGD